MPRKPNTATLTEYDIRITPTDQLPITKEDILESHLKDAEIVIVGEEGGNPSLRLHYHMYVKARLSETTISKICSKLGRANQTQKGNAVFSIRKAHEHSIGYVVKGKQIIYHNQDQKLIEEYFKKSDDYLKTRETDRRAASRLKEKTLMDIMKEVEVDYSSTPESVVAHVLKKYHEYGLKFPMRSQLETAILAKLYPHNPLIVINFYSKNLYSTFNH